MKTTPGKSTIRCKPHGRTVWLGDVICNECGRVYIAGQVDAAGNATYQGLAADGLCACGDQLMPISRATARYTARAVCRGCARAVKAHPRGAA